MGESVFFRNITTKGLTAVNSGERYFEGYLTVQVKDKQGEVTIVDELMKVLPIWIDRGAPISDTHSNRIIGKGINYAKTIYKDSDGEEYPAIKVTGKIHKNYELDNDIWAKIKSGEYKGLSFGGATKSEREPMRMKDGSIAYSLKDLEHYEVAVCRDPAVPLALITEINTLAKAAVDGEDIGGGRMLIKCTRFGCYVDKDSNEAGLKVPEAKNEALVYNDTSKDQPIELETKGASRDESEAILRHATDQNRGVKDSIVSKPHEETRERKISHEEAEANKADDDIPSAEDIEESEKRRKEEEEKKRKRIPAKPKESKPTWNPKVPKVQEKVEAGGQTKRNIPTSNEGIESYRGTEQGADETLRELDEAFGDKKKDPKKKKDKEKAVITNVLSRLKSLRLLTQGYSDEFKEDGDSWEQQTFKKRKRKKKAGFTPLGEKMPNYSGRTGKKLQSGVPNEEILSEEPQTKEGQAEKLRHNQQAESGQNYPNRELPTTPSTGKELGRMLGESDIRAGRVTESGAGYAGGDKWGVGQRAAASRLEDARRRKAVGEDWSNADGDRTSLYTQDVDEGGTGKHKQKKDGYGGEQNNSGEVGWSGSGSPYPKVSKNIRTTKAEWESFPRPERKPMNINIHDLGLGEIKTPKRKKKPTKAERERDEKEWKRDEKLSRQMDEDAAKELKNRDDVSREHSSHNTPTIPYDRMGTTGPRRKKATITNILSRLKSMDLLIKRGEFTYSELTTYKKKDLNLGETEWTEPRDTANDRRDSKLADTEKSLEALLLTLKGNKKGTRKKQPVNDGKRPDGSIPWNSPLRNPDGSMKDSEEKVERPKQSKFDKQRRYHNPKDLQTGERGEKTREATSSKAPQTGQSTNLGVVVDHTGAGKGATEEAEAKRVSSMLESKDQARREREEATGKKCNCESCRARRAEGNDDT